MLLLRGDLFFSYVAPILNQVVLPKQLSRMRCHKSERMSIKEKYLLITKLFCRMGNILCKEKESLFVMAIVFVCGKNLISYLKREAS